MLGEDSSELLCVGDAGDFEEEGAFGVLGERFEVWCSRPGCDRTSRDGWTTLLRHHAPDAPMVFALAHVVGFDELLGEEAGVVDPAAVDVADVDGAVGAGGEVHGAAPFVAAAEELGAITDPRGFERGAVRLDLVAGDELAGGIGDEDVVFEFGHQVAAIDAEATAGGVRASVRIGGGVGDL